MKQEKRSKLLLSEYKVDIKHKTREYYKNFMQIHLKT